MLTKGLTRSAQKKIAANFSSWGRMMQSADYIVVSCSSCGLALMQEWGFLEDSVFTRNVRDKVIHVSRLVNRYLDRLKTTPTQLRLFYHSPCHLKVQPAPESSIDMLRQIDGVVIEHPNTRCCGMAGAWGLSADHYDLSLAIGSTMRDQLNVSSADFGITDCPTCAMQMAQFSSKPIRHPIEITAMTIPSHQDIMVKESPNARRCHIS